MKGGSQVTYRESFSLKDNTGVVKHTVVEGGERGTEGEEVEVASELAAGAAGL